MAEGLPVSRVPAARPLVLHPVHDDLERGGVEVTLELLRGVAFVVARHRDTDFERADDLVATRGGRSVMLGDEVLETAQKIAAEAAGRPGLDTAREVLSNNNTMDEFLCEVVGIRCVEATSAEEAVDRGAVDSEKLGHALGGVGVLQQRPPCRVEPVFRTRRMHVEQRTQR